MRRNERGSAAIEFAFAAPIVIALLFATIEIGAVELMSSNLDAAMLSAARKIRTGSTDRPTSNAELTTMICARMADSAANCRQRLKTQVLTFTTFSAAQAAATSAPAGQFNAGGPGDIVFVNATYDWPLVLPMYGGGFRQSGPGQARLDARIAFRNEPYQ